MPLEGELTLELFDTTLTLSARRVYEAPSRMGFRFDATPVQRRTLLLQLFAHPKSWETVHDHEPRSNLTMFGLLMKGIVRAVLPALVLLVCASAHAEGIKESWYLMRGRANREIGNYKAAIEAYEKATEINPNNRDAMKTLGQAYEQQGLYDKAVGQYDKYLQRFPDDTDESFAQAERLKWSRYAYRRKDAILYYKQGLAQRDDPTMRLELAHLLAQDKRDVRPALDEYEYLLRRDPDNPTVQREYQKLLLWDDAMGARAIPEYERIWKARHDYDSGKTLAELYARDPSRHDQAVAQYREPARMRPEDVKTRRAYAGLLAQRTATHDEAVEEYGKLAKAGDRESRLAYAGLLARDDDTLPQAIEQYQIAAKDPKDARPHVGLARAYARMYERDKALEQARIAKKLAPNDPAVARLGYELEGRDGPAVSAKLDFLVQPSQGFKLYGVSATATGSIEIARRVVAGLHAGGEHFWDGTQSGSGAVIGGFAEVLVRDGDLVSARFDEHTLATHGQELEVAYDSHDGPWRVRPSFARALRYDLVRGAGWHRYSRRGALASRPRRRALRDQPGQCLGSPTHRGGDRSSEQRQFSDRRRGRRRVVHRAFEHDALGAGREHVSDALRRRSTLAATTTLARRSSGRMAYRRASRSPATLTSYASPPARLSNTRTVPRRPASGALADRAQ